LEFIKGILLIQKGVHFITLVYPAVLSRSDISSLKFFHEND